MHFTKIMNITDPIPEKVFIIFEHLLLFNTRINNRQKCQFQSVLTKLIPFSVQQYFPFYVVSSLKFEIRYLLMLSFENTAVHRFSFILLRYRIRYMQVISSLKTNNVSQK